MKHHIQVDEAGRLIIPETLRKQYGLIPGSRIVFEELSDTILLARPVTDLSKIYIETTNRCNLTCTTCMRQSWDEPEGWMTDPVFQNILGYIPALPKRPTVFFGGYGEPLSHPEIFSMIRKVNQLGCRSELISNGTLLDEEHIVNLIESGLDLLWISIDGATPESYEDVRLGNELPHIIEHLRLLRRMRYARRAAAPQLGISFVAMEKNILDLPLVVEMGLRLGAKEFSVSNILPHSEELNAERLYSRALCEYGNGTARMHLPRFDAKKEIAGVLERIAFWFGWHTLSGQEKEHRTDTCPFVDRGSMSIRWDGKVSPCLPLLHSHSYFLGDHPRRHGEYHVGDVTRSNLLEIWQSEEYVSLRHRLKEFDFSPCTVCNSCEMAEQNDEDCFGSELPACGGCLWAQGFIRCP